MAFSALPLPLTLPLILPNVYLIWRLAQEMLTLWRRETGRANAAPELKESQATSAFHSSLPPQCYFQWKGKGGL